MADAVRSAIEVMLLYVSDTGDSVSFVAAAQVLSNFRPVFSVLGEGVGSSVIARVLLCSFCLGIVYFGRIGRSASAIFLFCMGA